MDIYKTIILAVDGSDVSRNALRHAVELTKQNNGTLIAVHVIPPIDVMDIETFKPESLIKGLKEEGKKILSEVRELAAGEDVKVQTTIEEGIPFEVICEAARNANADLIVMGSHGHTGIGKVFIGSVTERVISRAHCPVLVVK
ncbi:MAG: universal stress protein [Deferribacteres bacterium]|nr:universal stress protein [Deferribacteres bacterium]